MSRTTKTVEEVRCDYPGCEWDGTRACRRCHADLCIRHSYGLFIGDSGLPFGFLDFSASKSNKRRLLPWYLCLPCAEEIQKAVERLVEASIVAPA